MFHVLEHLECVIHKFVVLATVDIHHHTYTAGIVLVVITI
jgi:hypothetical protein